MNVGLLILRLVAGGTLAAHGAQKAFGVFGGHGIDGTAGFLDSLGFRPGRAHAWLLGLTELVGGLCLALGFLTPLASAAAVGVMLTAIATAHWTKGFFNQDGGYEFPLLMAATALAVAFTGPGRYSLDRLFDWTLAGDEWGIAALAVGVASFGLLLGERELRARRVHHHHHHHLPA